VVKLKNKGGSRTNLKFLRTINHFKFNQLEWYKKFMEVF